MVCDSPTEVCQHSTTKEQTETISLFLLSILQLVMTVFSFNGWDSNEHNDNMSIVVS